MARVKNTSPSANRDQGDRRPLSIGLLNNMSDGALQATERQFRTLLREAAPCGVDLNWRYFSLNGVERGAEARAYMLGRYEPVEQLPTAGVDVLIVTGAEPRADSFEQEAYWPVLARVIDWTQSEHVPTVWSCLAAHAAVWRLSGISRSRRPTKLTGVFELQPAIGHPLLEGAPVQAFTPHSRWNDLCAQELADSGYEIVSLLPDGGVDTFLGPGPSRNIFFQGHPEYDAGALEREYLRDVSRFLRGQQPTHPPPPASYFGPEVSDALQRLSERARQTPYTDLINEYPKVVQRHGPQMIWRPWASHIYSSWIRSIKTTEQHGRSSLAQPDAPLGGDWDRNRQ